MSKVGICRVLLHLSSSPEKYPALLQWSPLAYALLADSLNTSIYSSLHLLLAFHILHNHSLLQDNSSLIDHDYPSPFYSSCKLLKLHAFNSCLQQLGPELHASPHIHIWTGHNHIWIYMDKAIWECSLYVGFHEVLAAAGSTLSICLKNSRR